MCAPRFNELIKHRIKKDKLLMTAQTIDQIEQKLNTAMLSALFAKKERGQIIDIIRRYSKVCDDLSTLLSINLNFKEMGRVSNSWLETDKTLYVQKKRLIMKFWRDMLHWMLMKANKSLQDAKKSQPVM